MPEKTMKRNAGLTTDDDLDRAIARIWQQGTGSVRQREVEAEKELEAQLAIVVSLKPLNRESRQRVMDAAGHLLEADAKIPGVLRAYLIGVKAPL